MLERLESGCHANILSFVTPVVVCVILIPSLVNKYHLVLCWLRGGMLFSRAQEKYYDPRRGPMGFASPLRRYRRRRRLKNAQLRVRLRQQRQGSLFDATVHRRQRTTWRRRSTAASRCPSTSLSYSTTSNLLPLLHKA